MTFCLMCRKDQADVSLVQVVPAGWTGFNNFASVCAECRASDRYHKLVKQRKIISQPEAARR